MSNLSAALAKAALPERRLSLCLNAPLLEQVEQADRKAHTAETASKARRESGSETQFDRKQVRQYREAADDLRKQVADESVVVTLRALPAAKYASLLLAHKPRKDNVGDARYGVNTASFFPVLIRACLIDPEVTDDEYEQLLAVVNDATFDALAEAVLNLNRGRTAAIPFSATVS